MLPEAIDSLVPLRRPISLTLSVELFAICDDESALTVDQRLRLIADPILTWNHGYRLDSVTSKCKTFAKALLANATSITWATSNFHGEFDLPSMKTEGVSVHTVSTAKPVKARRLSSRPAVGEGFDKEAPRLKKWLRRFRVRDEHKIGIEIRQLLEKLEEYYGMLPGLESMRNMTMLTGGSWRGDNVMGLASATECYHACEHNPSCLVMTFIGPRPGEPSRCTLRGEFALPSFKGAGLRDYTSGIVWPLEAGDRNEQLLQRLVANRNRKMRFRSSAIDIERESRAACPLKIGAVDPHRPLVIGAIGTSLTWGSDLPSRRTQAWPVVLQSELRAQMGRTDIFVVTGAMRAASADVSPIHHP